LVESVIEVEGLVKTYGDLRALDGISINVYRGEVLALLGPNGAGKTTAIEIMQALRDPTSGSVRILGQDVTTESGAREVKKRMGVLPQSFSALDRLTVLENVTLFSRMYESPRDPLELLKLLDLTDKAKVLFDDLSGGLKQRVGIAAALVNDPELVFLDEPTTGLDPRSRREVWDIIRGLRGAGKTVLLTTHYMDEAEVLADRIAIICKGRIAAIDSPHVLLERYGGKKTVIVEETPPDLASKLKERFPGARALGSDVSIHVESASEIASVMEFLSAMGHEKDISIRNPSIEEVFLKLVGSMITEEGELA
jgi:ABC-2 type transport system ATP-binding protein